MMEIIIDAPTPELKEAIEKKIAEHLEREHNDRFTDKTNQETS
jgi:hypothetical protein